MTELVLEEFCYVDTAFGGVIHRNKVVKLSDLKIPPNTPDCFTGMYRFPEKYLQLCESTGSVSGASGIPCYTDFIWFDIDSPDLSESLATSRVLVDRLEKLKCGLPEAIFVYFSGMKGFHIGVPSALFGLKPAVDLPAICRELALQIADGLKIDTSIYDRNRLWRTPNTRHGKSDLYKTMLTLDQFRQCSVDDIRAFAKTPLGPPFVTENRFLAAIAVPELETLYSLVSSWQMVSHCPTETLSPNGSGWMHEVLSGISQGNRHISFGKVIGKLVRDGWDSDSVISLLKPHAEKYQFPQVELRQEVESMHGLYCPTSFPMAPTYMEGKPENESFCFRPLNSDELFELGGTEIDWLVRNLFPAKGVSIIAGLSGVGKTWLLLDLAIAIATGGKWLGIFQVKPMQVLYIDEESGAQLLSVRLQKLLEHKGIGNDKLEIRFLVQEGFSFDSKNALKALRCLIPRETETAILVDSLIRVHGANENSATEISQVFAKVRRLTKDFPCSIIMLDHQRKAGQFETRNDQLLRGSSDKLASVDSLLSLTQQQNQLVAEHSKSRYGIPVQGFRLTISDCPDKSVEICYNGTCETKEDRQKEVEQFICNSVGDAWKSRQDLIEAAERNGFSAKRVSAAIKSLFRQGNIETKCEKLTPGRGGSSKFYRRAKEGGLNG